MIVEKIYGGTDSILRVYKGSELIFDGLIRIIKDNVVADGGTFDEALFKSEFNSQSLLTRNEAKYLLIPGAYKAGTIYGIEPMTGKVVKFDYTRSGTATYIDKNGDMQTAASNVPRIAYDPLTLACLGYMKDKTATNYATNSNSFPAAGAFWSDVTTGIMYKGISFTQGTTGTASNNMRTVGGIPASQSRICISFYIKQISGTTPVWGIYVNRSPSGSGAIRINIQTGEVTQNGTNLTISTGSQSLGNGYYRAFITLNDWLEGGSFLMGYSNNAGGVYQLSSMQVENSERPTSYIPTEASQVTRPAELYQSQLDLIQDSASTVYMDMTDYTTGLTYRVRRGTSGSSNAGFIHYQNSPGQIITYDGTTSVEQVGVSNVNGRNKVTTSFGSSGLKIAANGSSVNTVAYDGAMGLSAPLYIYPTTSTGLVYGYTKTIAIFHKQLSDQQMTDLTS